MTRSANRLPLRFDAGLLRRDLECVPADAWITHFNTAYHDGGWSGVPLRAPAGATHPIQALHPSPVVTDWGDLPLLERCPAFRGVLGALGLEDGEVRLHVPVRTNPEVEFTLDGARVELGEGEVWYLDVNRPHAVANRGSSARVHLVIDCVVSESLREPIVDPRAPTRGLDPPSSPP